MIDQTHSSSKGPYLLNLPSLGILLEQLFLKRAIGGELSEQAAVEEVIPILVNGGIDAVNAHVTFEVAQVVEHEADVNLVVCVCHFVLVGVCEDSFGDFDDVWNRVSGYHVG